MVTTTAMMFWIMLWFVCYIGDEVADSVLAWYTQCF